MSTWKIDLENRTATYIRSGVAFKISHDNYGEYIKACIKPEDIPPNSYDDEELSRLISEAETYYQMELDNLRKDEQYLMNDRSAYELGLDNLNENNHIKALGYLKISADEENNDAQNLLGEMYLKGQGVDKNYGEAVMWFRLAANQGNIKASTNLGLMYKKGLGVLQDTAEADRWLNTTPHSPFSSIPDEESFKKKVVDYEISLIKQALEKTSGVKNKAARLLGLNRTTLVEKIKKHRL